jgi:hypothetical protein
MMATWTPTPKNSQKRQSSVLAALIFCPEPLDILCHHVELIDGGDVPLPLACCWGIMVG